MNRGLALFQWEKVIFSKGNNTTVLPKKVDEKHKKGIQLAKVTRVAIL